MPTFSASLSLAFVLLLLPNIIDIVELPSFRCWVRPNEFYCFHFISQLNLPLQRANFRSFFAVPQKARSGSGNNNNKDKFHVCHSVCFLLFHWLCFPFHRPRRPRRRE